MKVVLVTCSPDAAADLVRTVVSERLAACGNVVTGVRSIYRWKGAICDETEALVVMETSDARAPLLMERVRELHAYETPKILAFDPKGALDAYARWVDEETTVTP